MNIALIGYGKMGKEIEKIAIDRGHTISAIIDIDNTNFDAEGFMNADVAIEFTTPSTAFNNYLECFKRNKPVVSGTTGWLDKFDEVKEYCNNKGQTFFYASNFSVGVNVLFEINKKLAKIMNTIEGYNVSLEETHHIHKKDSPSGTALTLIDGLIENLDSKDTWNESDTVKDNEVQVIAHREGEVSGIHSVKYESDIDEIMIYHSAKSRKGFALGAVLAAEFAAKNKGLLSMNDLLKF